MILHIDCGTVTPCQELANTMVTSIVIGTVLFLILGVGIGILFRRGSNDD